MSDSSPLELPELTQSVLTTDDLEALFRDIAELTEVVEIIPKLGARERVDDTAALTLDSARQGLLGGDFRGVQLRYLHEGGLWWDTLLRVPEGFSIVRIRHDPQGEIGVPKA